MRKLCKQAGKRAHWLGKSRRQRLAKSRCDCGGRHDMRKLCRQAGKHAHWLGESPRQKLAKSRRHKPQTQPRLATKVVASTHAHSSISAHSVFCNVDCRRLPQCAICRGVDRAIRRLLLDRLRLESRQLLDLGWAALVLERCSQRLDAGVFWEMVALGYLE